jgi:isopentenyl-diphosphate delta-isomerase
LAEAARPLGDEVVSDDSEPLILVDEDDREIGFLSKSDCHDGDGVLHRAFSLFVFNRKGELLLQRRSVNKRLWPLYWSNSCCSHPRRGETMDEAIHRRLHQELRIYSDLRFLYKFQYQARYEDLGSENEVCWVYVGISDDEVQPNGNEVEEWRWVSRGELDEEMQTRSEVITPWFQLEWNRVREAFRDVLGLE